MKKFLSILLALAVGFTFTFGSAMSAFATEYNANPTAEQVIAGEQAALADVVKSAKNKITYTGGYVTGFYSITGVTFGADYAGLITSEAVNHALKTLVSDVYDQKIYDKAWSLIKDGTLSDADVKEIQGVWADADSVEKVLTIFTEKGKYTEALKKQTELDKTAALAAIDAAAAKSGEYSTEEYLDAKNNYISLDDRKYTEGKSEAGMLDNAVKTAKAAIEAVTGTGKKDILKIRTAASAFNGKFKAGNTADASFFNAYADANHKYFMTLTDRQNALTSYKNLAVKDMESRAQKFEESYTTYLQTKIADIKETEKEKAKAQEQLASLPADLTAVIGSYTDRLLAVEINDYYTPKMAYEAIDGIKAEVEKTLVSTVNKPDDYEKFQDAVDKASEVTSLIAYAKSYAETLKTTYVDDSTELKYDASVIETILATALQKIKDGEIDTKAGVRNFMDNYADTLARADIALAVERVDALNALDAFNEDGIAPASAYDDADYASLGRLDAINALRDKAVADVNAATTVKGIKDIVSEFRKAVGAYLTDEQCDAVYKSSNVNTALNSKGVGTARSFAELATRDVNAYFVGKTGYSTAAVNAIINNIKHELKVAVCGLGKTNPSANDAYNAMVKAYNNIFTKEIAKAKTTAETAAEATKVTDLIKAIDTPVTQASRDKITAAREAYDAYVAIPGAKTSDIKNVNNLDNAESRLKYLDKAEILAAYAALANKDITVADKDAVAAIEELNAAYKNNWNEKSGYENGIAIIKGKYVKAAVQSFIAKASALPAEIAAKDADAVKAAREAYDEIVRLAKEEGYTEEYLKAFLKNTYDAGDLTECYGNILKSYIKLENAEKTLGIVTAVTNKDVKAYLNTLKVTVKSAKTAKKNVKVTAKVTVRATGDAADFTKFTDAGYTFKYKFYRSTKTTVKYTVKKAKDTTTWTNTAGKKGTKYYYKVKVFAYDKDGKFVGQTYQSQCNYTSKVFGK